MKQERDQDLARGRTKAMPVDSRTAAVNEPIEETVPLTSYDENQRDAPLLECKACGRLMYVTQPEFWLICAECAA